MPLLLTLLSAAPAAALVLPTTGAPLTSTAGDAHLENVIGTVLFQGRSIPMVSHIDVIPIGPPPPPQGDPGPTGGADHGAPADAPPAGAGQHWCGAQRRTDDGPAADRPAVQLIYAFPADRPDRFAQFRDVLQSNASSIRSFLATASGGRKTLRFAGGADCGGGSVDIGVLPLSGRRSAYLDPAGAPSLRALGDEVKAAFPPRHAVPVNYLVFADNLASPSDCRCLTGMGMHYEDSTKSSPSIHDTGGLTAAVWGVDGWGPDPDATSAFPELLLHEITHTLGGVANDAPHATGAGHCTDQADVMCYADGGPNNLMTSMCPFVAGAIQQAYDCGADDYFNPTPAPDSYLATHWNVYDSAFLEPAPAAPASGDPPTPEADTPTAPRTVRRLHAAIMTPGGTRVGSAVLNVTRTGATRVHLVQAGHRLRLRTATGHAGALRLILCAWRTTADGSVLSARRCADHAVRSPGARAALLPLSRVQITAPRGHLRASLTILARRRPGRWHRYAATAPRALSIVI